jgi:hypothetical protein
MNKNTSSITSILTAVENTVAVIVLSQSIAFVSSLTIKSCDIPCYYSCNLLLMLIMVRKSMTAGCFKDMKYYTNKKNVWMSTPIFTELLKSTGCLH